MADHASSKSDSRTLVSTLPSAVSPAERIHKPNRLILKLTICTLAFGTGLQFASAYAYHHTVWINHTESLPNWMFIVDRGRLPVAGQIIVFKPNATPLVTSHFGKPVPMFGKLVGGVAGDRVERHGQQFFVNGRLLATAKLLSLRGEHLTPGPYGIIPPGQYFVYTPHKDGFDSRYADIGWVDVRLVIGVGRPIL